MNRLIRALVCTFLLAAAACSAPVPDSAPASGETATGSAPDLRDIQSADPPDAPALDIPDDDPATASALEPWTGDFDGMVERRFIRVLTTYSKTLFFLDKGAQKGLVVDAFKLFEDDLNKKLKNKNIRVTVLFVPVAHDELIPALVDGRGDVVAAMKAATTWRKELVDFTKPTRTNVSSIVVTGPGTPPIANLKDLSGKEVYLRASDISGENVKKFNAELAAEGKPPVKIRNAPEVLADDDILEMVNAGLVPITVADDYIAEFWQQVFPKLTLNKTAVVRADGETAMMLRKNSPQLMAELNAFLGRYNEGSLQRNVLFQKYLKSAKYAQEATSSKDAERFEQVVEFIKKYSDQYKLDYLLMAAQGYQESGLDQSRKSHVGAIGVMQVMPATGADMKVGDITQTENNIHAGVKYMRFMIDRYYANEPMELLDKGLFTFASYNAGPGRVRQLRERAAKRGLDRNKWFNNVEIIAGEVIGRETVQYVSNIYKYYLAYTMMVEQREERLKAKAAQ